MIKDDKNKRVVVIIPTTHLKDTINKCLFNEMYANILYLIVSKGYSYNSEVRKLCGGDTRHYFAFLHKNNVIEKFELSKEQKDSLKVVKGLHRDNFVYLQAYRLTPEAKVILQSPNIYDLMIDKMSDFIKRYVVDLQDRYTEKTEKEKKDFELKVYRAKMKQPRYRTAEDLAILEIIKNE